MALGLDGNEASVDLFFEARPFSLGLLRLRLHGAYLKFSDKLQDGVPLLENVQVLLLPLDALEALQDVDYVVYPPALDFQHRHALVQVHLFRLFGAKGIQKSLADLAQTFLLTRTLVLAHQNRRIVLKALLWIDFRLTQELRSRLFVVKSQRAVWSLVSILSLGKRNDRAWISWL